MVLPNFLGVGAAKAGTTTIASVLNQNPEIFIPEYKEVHFFDYDNHYKKGIKWYEKELRRNYNNEFMVGEFSPLYMYLDKCQERILETLGHNVKLIFVLRDPVERAYSQYKMNVGRGLENLNFLDALKNERERIAKDERSNILYSYVARGKYYNQIKNYVDNFGWDKVHIVFFEDYIETPKKVLGRIENFLGVNNWEYDITEHQNESFDSRLKFIENKVKKNKYVSILGRCFIPNYNKRRKLVEKVNKLNRKGKQYEKLSESTKDFLFNSYFAEDVEKLEALVGRRLNFWRV